MSEFYSFGRPIKSAAPVEKHARDTENDFISILATAQALHIDFLPIPWHQALETLGIGKTGELRDAYINIESSLAFKRVKKSWQRKATEKEIFNALASEVCILGQPSIRAHPNVIQLEGICFDVVPETSKVWPVLIFEKTELGDLERFANSDAGRCMPWNTRLELCADIGSAINEMHSRRVIHGDIKPQNVLIFHHSSIGYTAKVADFGFSTYFAGSGLVYMPRTMPWQAPEWHHRGFTMAEAIRMDVYSYGVLCMWLLFYNAKISPTKHLAHDLESQGQSVALTLAQRLTRETSEISEETRHGLAQFFDCTIAEEPTNRVVDLKHLLSLLPCSRILTSSPVEQHSPKSLPLDDFQITYSLYQLYSLDFRVRNHLFRCLDTHVGNPKISCPNLVLQLALCYMLGFGIQRDEVKAEALLQQHGLQNGNEDLQQLIQSIVHDSIPSHFWFRDGKFNELLLQGQIRRVLFAERYHDRSMIETYEFEYRREIQTLENVLGEDHGILVIVKEDLASMFSDMSNWDKAAVLQLQILESCKKIHGTDNQATYSSAANLAATYGSMGKFAQAKEMLLEVLQWRIENLGEHSSSLTTMTNLGIIHRNTGSLEEAENLYSQVKDKQQRTLGTKHRDTLKTMALIVDILTTQGRYYEAEELADQVLLLRNQVLGEDDPDTLSTLTLLIGIYQLQGRYAEVEELGLPAHRRMARVLGEEHCETLACLSALATACGKQLRLVEAEALASRALKASERAFGEQHPETLSHLFVMVTVHQQLRRFDLAERLGLKLIDSMYDKFGEAHPSALAATANLAVTYTSQGRLSEAEIMTQRVIEATDGIYGEECVTTLSIKSNLVAIYIGQKRWADGESLCRKILEYWTQQGFQDRARLQCMSRLVTILSKQERWQESKELGEQMVASMENVLGEHDPLTQAGISQLARSYKWLKNFDNAERLESQIVRNRKATLGEKSPATLESMHNLAFTLFALARRREALELMERVVLLSTETLGADHPDTLESTKFVTAWRRI